MVINLNRTISPNFPSTCTNYQKRRYKIQIRELMVFFYNSFFSYHIGTTEATEYLNHIDG